MYSVGAKCLLDFPIIFFHILLCWERSSRNTFKKPAIVSMAAIKYLMDHLPKENLGCLSWDEAIISKVAILPATFAKGDDV
jgi:hypothetical protein